MKTVEKEIERTEEKKTSTEQKTPPKRTPFKREDKTAGFWRTLFPYMKPFRKNIIIATILSMITGLPGRNQNRRRLLKAADFNILFFLYPWVNVFPTRNLRENHTKNAKRK